MSRQRTEVPLQQGCNRTLTAADGHRLDAWCVALRGPAAGGLVLLHEIFGVNAHIRAVAQDYAVQGYRVVTPALFDRARRGVALDYGAADIGQGRRLREAIPLEQTLLDLAAALAAAGPGPVAVLGYCWGGTLAFLAATRLEGVACAVSYYGGQTLPFAREIIRVPVQMHFGSEDPRITAADRAAIQAGNPAIELHLYPADHGFNCDHRSQFHAASAALARERALAFLARHARRAAASPAP